MSDLTENGVRRRNLLIGGALLSTAAIAYAKTPRRNLTLLDKNVLEEKIPKNVGAWQYETSSGLVLPPSDQLKEGIYNDLLTRVYDRADGRRMMLLIAYSRSQEGSLQVHRPEICYPASGYRIEKNVRHDVSLGPGRAIPTQFLTADGNARQEQLIYWTRVGEYFPRRWIDQRISVIESRMSGIIPDGILVRLSTIGSDAEEALNLLDDFARSLTAAVDPKTRQALIGSL